MGNRKSDNLLPKYQTAIHLMRDGRYDILVPSDPNDEYGKLGHGLNDLARELEKKYNEAIKLREIAEEITAGMFLDDILNRIYASFRPIIPYDRMGYALLDDEKTRATASWVKTDTSKIKLKIGYAAAMAGSSLQEIIETGQPRILNDLQSYLAEHPTSTSTKLIVEEGMNSSLTCPLIAQGKPVGFLFFSSTKKDTYQDIHQDIFLQIAGQVSILVEKSRLYQQLYELNHKLLLAQKELQYQATYDVLTGIYNRRAIWDHLEAELARAKRQNKPLSVVLLDVDHFKRINDTYGHPAGDMVLMTVADRMKNCLRDYEFIGRYGGEEFLVVLVDTDYEAAMKTTTRLIQAIGGEAFVFDDKQLAITISAGVAVVENCAKIDSEKVISSADRELYNAKLNGRNRIEICRIGEQR